MKVIVSYSGGKDSMLAMYKAMQEHEVVAFFTTANTTASWFHDIDFNILLEVSKQINIPFEKLICSANEDYTKDFENKLLLLKEKYDFDAIVFGDIDIIEHKQWVSDRCNNLNLKCLLPLWQIDRLSVCKQVIDLGFKAIIKKVTKSDLDQSFLNKQLDYKLLEELDKKGCDLCGENGEYHTIVVDGPIFKEEVKVKILEVVDSKLSYSLRMCLDE